MARDAMTERIEGHRRRRKMSKRRRNREPIQRDLDDLGWVAESTKAELRRSKVRSFEIRTKPWSNGLEVHIFEGKLELGCTQTANNEVTRGAALFMASEWIESSYGLASDEYFLRDSGEYTDPA